MPLLTSLKNVCMVDWLLWGLKKLVDIFSDDIFNLLFLDENVCILSKIPMDLIENKSTLVHAITASYYLN